MKAKAFKALNQDGKSVSLADYKGKWVVLYFYPRDMTPGCTQEACDFNEELAAFKKAGAVILGVSKDSVESHAKFAAKYKLKFDLLSDPDGKMCKAYGVWQEKSLYGRKFMGIVRSTFVISPEGQIVETIEKVKVKGHAALVLDLVRR